MAFKEKKPLEKLIDKDVDIRQSSIEFETRAEGNAGYFSGYAIKWNSVDSYGTYFSKGCCKKTLSERWGSKISERKVKLLWNHEHTIPIGVPVELREDDIGLYFEAQLNLDTQLGRELYSLMKQGAVNTMSFGFYKVHSTFDSRGVENIKEITLLEISPVIFESNKEAVINEVRSDSEQNIRKQLDDFIMTIKNEKPVENTDEVELKLEKKLEARSEEQAKEVENKVEQEVEERQKDVQEETEERAQDFEETKKDLELQGFNYRLQRVLEETLLDIWWDSDFVDDDFISKLDKALMDFHASYLEHAQEFIARFGKAERSEQFENEYQKRFSDYLENSGKDFDTLVRNTSLTDSDIKALQRGKSHFVAASKLVDLDEELRSIVKDATVNNIKTLKSEIRTSDISKADKKILSALLFTKDSEEVSEERSLTEKEAGQNPEENKPEEPVAEQRSVEDILKAFASELKTNITNKQNEEK